MINGAAQSSMLRISYCLSWECNGSCQHGYAKGWDFCLSLQSLIALPLMYTTFCFNACLIIQIVFLLFYLCGKVFWFGRRFCLDFPNRSHPVQRKNSLFLIAIEILSVNSVEYSRCSCKTISYSCFIPWLYSQQKHFAEKYQFLLHRMWASDTF